MTVPTTTGASRYTGNGATSTYNVGFHFQANSDLEVIVVNTTTDTDTTLTLTTHYTVTGAGDQSGGQITLIGAYANLAATNDLYIGLAPAMNNSTALVTGGKVSNAQLQIAFDRMSQRCIRLQTQVDRCLKLPLKEVPTSTKTTISDVTDRSSKALTFDSSGNPSASSSVPEGSLSVTAIGETIVEAANAGAVLDALGFTTATKALIDETSNANFMTQLGITAAAQTVLDDASVAAMRATLGLDGSSGNVGPDDLSNAAIAQLFQARLTLTSATPVLTADVSSAGTIYLTPYKGNKVAIYNGTRWKLYALTEISLALTATSGKPYDVWVYDNAGTLTLETTVWTDDTNRATALAVQDGVYCKTGALTRRYVGTFYASGSNVTSDTSLKRYVWNYYNRVPRSMATIESTATWTYTTATARLANGAAGNRLDWVQGVSEDHVHGSLISMSSNTSANVNRRAGVGLDSVTTFASAGSTEFNSFRTGLTNPSSANEIREHVCQFAGYVSAGRHFVTWLEYSEATGATTWYGADLSTGSSGLFATVMA